MTKIGLINHVLIVFIFGVLMVLGGLVALQFLKWFDPIAISWGVRNAVAFWLVATVPAVVASLMATSPFFFVLYLLFKGVRSDELKRRLAKVETQTKEQIKEEINIDELRETISYDLDKVDIDLGEELDLPDEYIVDEYYQSFYEAIKKQSAIHSRAFIDTKLVKLSNKKLYELLGKDYTQREINTNVTFLMENQELFGMEYANNGKNTILFSDIVEG